MTLDSEFYRAVERLFVPGMGTEHVGPLLYSLVRMMRPRSVLEVGLGYSTPFLVAGLKDNIEEFRADREVLKNCPDTDQRKSLLSPEYYATDYKPTLQGIDDYSTEGTSAPKALEVLEELGLDSVVEVHKGDFRGYSKKLNPSVLPFDLVWFDCGALPEYVDFIEEYWRLINPEQGMLLLH